ncbi:hypothetical protein BGP77_12900 [Saccharospirillum sp. MSK14-1]|uniref:transporter substrate-binding domain-containing protein n=1 Tax=Saccharospirillum sp. MSK14-1 TaxID=1897632 RepID=UPI000D41D26B|nr:transporter substrate-binding domain-containing protein [Saccharospirillum sp. MSK14-1]PTY37402.1 hypothetical protein BGP77_12900 [Saccharospirillum sp. MSK14-1]
MLADTTLTIVSEPWPPYVTEQIETPGFDVEVTEAVLAQLGFSMELQLLPWRRAMIEVNSGQADALLDAFDSPERRRHLHYPDEPLSYSTSFLYCYACDHHQAPSLADLEGSVVAVNRGYQYHDAFDVHPGIDRIPVDTFEQGFRLLQRGRVEYYAVNNQVAAYVLQHWDDANIKPLAPSLAPAEPVYLVFADKPGYDDMAQRFSDELQRFKRTPAYRAILRRYGLNSP